MKFSLFYLTTYFPEIPRERARSLRPAPRAGRRGRALRVPLRVARRASFFRLRRTHPFHSRVGATIAARTKKMKIASGIVMIGLQDPIRVAEQFAMLDQLSGGRVIFGIGRGFQKCEFDAFQRKMDDSRIAFEEAHEVSGGRGPRNASRSKGASRR